ncbi:Ankyrin-3 [Lachnellula suecica]|uniref:Ankyrin-3 n=1 Tax=Lachnellula suecica TaxID=602035 RepID=A0A8T9BTY9_9HELO|nr:Ankyrin-3 [Lachnellula suecica]
MVVLNLLIKAGTDIRAQDVLGQTPLYFAAMHGHYDICTELIALGAYFQIRTADGTSCLHAAAKKGSISIMELLVMSGVDINAVTFDEITPLHMATLRDLPDAISFLQQKSAFVEARDTKGRTPLNTAVRKDRKNSVRQLLKGGVEVDAQDKKRRTLLYIAAEKGHSEIVEMLLQFGAKLDIPSSSGYTALHVATIGGHQEIVQLLVNHGSDVNRRSETIERISPLHLAAKEEETEIARILIAHGAKIDVRTASGDTPLHLAVFEQTAVFAGEREPGVNNIGLKQSKVADKVRETADEILSLLRPLTIPPSGTTTTICPGSPSETEFQPPIAILSVNTFSSHSYPKSSMLGEKNQYSSSITITAEFRSLSAPCTANKTQVVGQEFRHLSLVLPSLAKLSHTKINHLKWFISPDRLALLQAETRQNATAEALLKIHNYIAPMQLRYPLIRCLSFREQPNYRNFERNVPDFDRIARQGDSATMYAMHDELDGGYGYEIEQKETAAFGLEPQSIELASEMYGDWVVIEQGLLRNLLGTFV